ncbi:MAG: hypothetical protein NT137_06380 [Methanomassiliicoccales archaeon]|nr:hypothetical protein [Methanomassiliicoccales archaeon]
MAEERNLHLKLAGAEVLGLIMIAWATFVVAMIGLKVIDFDALGATLAMVATVSTYVGVGLLLATLVSFLNENMLLTAAFGILAFFFLAFPGFATTGAAAMYATIFVGIALLLLTVVAFMQPVKLLPILLLVAAILFFVLGAWLNEPAKLNTSDMRMIVGIFSLLVFLISVYMAAAIGLLTMKGKPVLPLLITK